MPWYEGPTLIDILDTLETPIRLTDKPLRMPIMSVCKVKGIGTVVIGKVETGLVKENM